MSSPRLAGIREPGLRRAGAQTGGGGGGGGGSTDAVDIQIADAGNYYASGNLEGATQAIGAALALRPLAADLASTATGKGASLVGVENAGDWQGMGGTDLEHFLTVASNIIQGVNDQVQLFPSNLTGEGASLIGIEDAGGLLAATTVEGAIAELAARAATAIANAATAASSAAAAQGDATTAIANAATAASSAATAIANAATANAGVATNAAAIALRPLTTDLAALTAGKGASLIGIQDAGGLIAATTVEGALAEFASRVTFAAVTNVIGNGSAATPAFTIGTAADLIGFYRSSSQELGIAVGGTRLARLSTSGYYSDVFFAAPLSSAAAPTFTVNGTTGGSGLYGVANGVALSAMGTGIFLGQKTASPFVFTAPSPGANNTAATEFVGLDLNMARTSTWSAGTVATQREVLFRAPTYAGASATAAFTTAATVAISGAPIMGGNAGAAIPWSVRGGGAQSDTFPNTLALWTQGGIARHDVADTLTTGALEALNFRRTSSATAAAGLGVALATVDLQNASGFIRRAAQDVVSWSTTPTDGSEEAVRTVSIMAAGTLQKVGGWGVAAGGYMLYVGDPGNISGLRWSGSNRVELYAGGASRLDYNAGVLSLNAGLNVTGGWTQMVPTVSASATTSKFSLTPGADTGTTASTEAFDVDFNFSRIRTWATGALATQRAMRIKPPTYAFGGASTITSAATFAVEGAPIAGANATITNAYALWVQAGGVRFDGTFGFGKTPVGVQSTTGTATGFTAGGGTAVTDSSTFTGGSGATAYRISDVVLALKNLGWLAQ
jgi:hypothetical protein